MKICHKNDFVQIPFLPPLELEVHHMLRRAGISTAIVVHLGTILCVNFSQGGLVLGLRLTLPGTL